MGRQWSQGVKQGLALNPAFLFTASHEVGIRELQARYCATTDGSLGGTVNIQRRSLAGWIQTQEEIVLRRGKKNNEDLKVPIECNWACFHSPPQLSLGLFSSKVCDYSFTLPARNCPLCPSPGSFGTPIFQSNLLLYIPKTYHQGS